MSSMFTSLTHSDTPGGRLTFALLTCAYVGLITAGSSACGNTTHVAPEVLDAGEGPDATDDCARAAAELQAFLAQHRSCESDADCTTVGDCGPYIVHEPVNLAGADQARALQLKTCGSGYDGETDGAACEHGQCVRVPGAGVCCGCYVEPVIEADYYVRFQGVSQAPAKLRATSLNGAPVDLIEDEIPSGEERLIFHAIEGTGGHAMPSNFFGTFELSVDSSVLYSGVDNQDWKESTDHGLRYTLSVSVPTAP